jgi:hypothetical protein
LSCLIWIKPWRSTLVDFGLRIYELTLISINILKCIDLTAVCMVIFGEVTIILFPSFKFALWMIWWWTESLNNFWYLSYISYFWSVNLWKSSKKGWSAFGYGPAYFIWHIQLILYVWIRNSISPCLNIFGSWTNKM